MTLGFGGNGQVVSISVACIYRGFDARPTRPHVLLVLFAAFGKRSVVKAAKLEGPFNHAAGSVLDVGSILTQTRALEHHSGHHWCPCSSEGV